MGSTPRSNTDKAELDKPDSLDNVLAKFSDEVGFTCVAHDEGLDCCVDIGDSNYPKLKAAINQYVLKARLAEVKLCQGEKAVSKEAYLQNRHHQLEYELKHNLGGLQ